MEICFVATYSSSRFGRDEREEVKNAVREALREIGESLCACHARDGHALFSIKAAAADEAFFACVAQALRNLRDFEYVYARLASCRLSDAGTKGYSGSERAQRGISAVKHAVEAALLPNLNSAMLIWKVLNKSSGNPRTFYCGGQRGGRGHSFSSDELKRACAQCVRDLSFLDGAKKRDADVHLKAQIHNRSFWLGLCLNAAPLSTGAAGRKKPKKLAKETPSTLFEWRRAGHSPLNVHDAVTPLASMTRAEQLKRKAEDLSLACKNLGFPEIDRVHSCGPQNGYRNKVEFFVARDPEIVVGFKVGDRVVSPADCVNIPKEMVATAEAFQSFLASSPLPVVDRKELSRRKNQSRRIAHDALSNGNVGVWSKLITRSSVPTPATSSTFMAIVVVDSVGLECADSSVVLAEERRLVSELKRHASSIYLKSSHHLTKNIKTKEVEKLIHGDATLLQSMRVDDKRSVAFEISPSTFFQVNTPVAEYMYRQAIAQAGDDPFVLLDVCCGAGTLSIFAACSQSCVGTVGIDSCFSAIENAKKSAALNCVSSKTTFIHGRIEKSLDIINQSISSAASGASRLRVVAIVDPPRIGIPSKVSKALCSLDVIDVVIFISCNPLGKRLRRDFVVKNASLADNIGALAKRFSPRLSQGFDMFPHTPHCELMLVLDRK